MPSFPNRAGQSDRFLLGSAAGHQRVGGRKHPSRVLTSEPMQSQPVAQRGSQVGCAGAFRQRDTSNVDSLLRIKSFHIARKQVLKPAATRDSTVHTAHNYRAAFSGQRTAKTARNVKMRAAQSPNVPSFKQESDELRAPITVIATDVDGTLLDSKQQLRGETVEALKAAMARGIQVSFQNGQDVVCLVCSQVGRHFSGFGCWLRAVC